MAYTDAAGYQAILAIATGQGGIEAIWFGATSPHNFTNQSYPMLWIRPTGWEQSEDSDPPEPLRTCSFELRICATGDGSMETFTRLDQIAGVLVEALQHQDLGGAIPALTSFQRGKLESSHQVEQLTVIGSFSYLRDDPSNP